MRHFVLQRENVGRNANTRAITPRAPREDVLPSGLSLFLQRMAEVRAITSRRPGLIRPSCVIISSVRPSLKYP